MKVLSLFDGMACGVLALKSAGIKIDEYNAYEIDKYCIKTVQHNFPFVKHNGNVFEGDFTKHKNVDLLIGGSPCTYWSICKTKGRETTASGLGWDLFCQYIRALKETQPKYFIYENNKSISKEIQDSISKELGVKPIMINSALVSAQNRERLYWVGKLGRGGTDKLRLSSRKIEG